MPPPLTMLMPGYAADAERRYGDVAASPHVIDAARRDRRTWPFRLILHARATVISRHAFVATTPLSSRFDVAMMPLRRRAMPLMLLRLLPSLAAIIIDTMLPFDAAAFFFSSISNRRKKRFNRANINHTTALPPPYAMSFASPILPRAACLRHRGKERCRVGGRGVRGRWQRRRMP